MKSFLITLFLIVASFGCHAQNTKEFPDQLKTVKTAKYKRIQGTKVSALIPDGYQYIKELARYQKNDNLYVQVIETANSNFLRAREGFTREKIEAKGARVDVLKNIKLNQFDAIYAEGPSKYPGETKLTLIFGDESFVVMIVGVCKTDDTAGKMELMDILKSVYYDKAIQLDPLELANFEFDHTITNFKYAGTTSTIFYFAQNGKSDIQNPTANIFQIGLLPKTTEENAYGFVNDLPWRYETKGIKVDNKTITKTKVNNYTAFLLSSKTIADNKPGIIYITVLVGEKSNVVFIGSAYNSLDDYLTKFKKTVASIKIK